MTALIIAAGTQVALAETPVQVVVDDDHPLIQNVRRSLSFDTSKTEEYNNFVIDINKQLISKGHDLFADPILYMNSPVLMINNNTVEARTRRFQYRLIYKPTDIEEEKGIIRERIINEVVDNLHVELRAAIAASPNTAYCPYIPITASGPLLVDPLSGEYVLLFTTRYGVLDDYFFI